MKNLILDLIESRQLKIGVIGLGYAGLPIALRFVDAGFSVLGIDKDELKVNLLKFLLELIWGNKFEARSMGPATSWGKKLTYVRKEIMLLVGLIFPLKISIE